LPRTLIIAEKPSVATDIARVVGAVDKSPHAWEGPDHVVSWAVGHLLEFVAPEGYDANLKRWRLKDLPILPDQFLLTPVKGNTKQLNALKRLLRAKDVERVVNACDAGREGELIFREIFRFSGSDKPVDRLWLQSMTDDGIRQSLSGALPETEVQGLADAADCRAESDWLIGMNATRALTVRLRSQRDRVPWSAGRVQTATLAMLVRREKEILGHEPEPFWVIQATFATTNEPEHRYEATWFDPAGSGQRDRIFDPQVRDRVLGVLASPPPATAKETRKDSREIAPALLDLTSLQREANRRFGFSARRTLSAAQALYEQHKMITYPRTDSRALPSDYRDKVTEALRFLADRQEYGRHASRLLADGLANEGRNFDDAGVSDHFAIIPTGQGMPENLRADDQRVFDLVARRFLAAFHPPAISTEVERLTALGAETFRTRSRVLKVPGWKAVFDRNNDKEPRQTLPQLADASGSPAALVKHQTDERQTRPPARLTEAALLGLMETAGKEVEDADKARVLKETGGLGTPATRAEIIETLVDRQYAARCSSLMGRKALRATPRGIRLIDALERIDLPLLTSAELTANLEDALHDVENGAASRDSYMGEVRDWTRKIVEKIRGFSFSTLYEGTEAVGDCPACKQARIYESLRTWSCERGGREGPCEFVIWKEVGGRYVDRASAVELIERAETPVKAGFFSREGREYEASLVRTDDGRVLVRPKGAELEDSEDVKPADVGPCPYCKDKIVRRSSKGYRCDGYADRTCKLNLPLQVCQRPLALEEVGALIGPDRKTALLEGFISKRNRPFSATLHMDDGAKIRWDFPPRDTRRSNEPPSREFEVNPAPLCKCPRHPEADVVETATAFVCSDDSCRIRIPREICKRELSREEATELFTGNETRVLEGFTSRTGKPFSASLYIKRTGRHGFRFGPRGG